VKSADMTGLAGESIDLFNWTKGTVARHDADPRPTMPARWLLARWPLSQRQAELVAFLADLRGVA
jgi:hypothetical protein